MKKFIPKYIAEALGTFFLVLTGCGAAIVNDLTQGHLSTVGVGLVFGFIVMAMVYSIGHISGAHMNPAVTLGFFAARRLSGKETPFYLGAQFIGAILASLTLKIIFLNAESTWSVTQPTGSQLQSFLIEYFFSFLLMFVIMGVATDYRSQGVMAGVAIGGTIALEAIVGGPISGASMNPARSFGPALVSGIWNAHWIYWIAPILGCLTGATLYRLIACDQGTSESKTGCC